ncbi:Oidioi.mRNA.OKI2018_I69.chr1.g27.t1.cds [Oikopleura dioica]|uniref:Oidioi.mRNA.OKI2018_I69.chr1.g27.t1.cds n=1 Tax=Oikopleura dioica TaxID=34765 RepID=A0ABN7SMS6_OIKDI|nr:Oidioi.mRNA.OKI2018_I69.chr1.g27.t1.cds [Oikopleura dioica]
MTIRFTGQQIPLGSPPMYPVQMQTGASLNPGQPVSQSPSFHAAPAYAPQQVQMAPPAYSPQPAPMPQVFTPQPTFAPPPAPPKAPTFQPQQTNAPAQNQSENSICGYICFGLVATVLILISILNAVAPEGPPGGPIGGPPNDKSLRKNDIYTRNFSNSFSDPGYYNYYGPGPDYGPYGPPPGYGPYGPYGPPPGYGPYGPPPGYGPYGPGSGPYGPYGYYYGGPGGPYRMNMTKMVEICGKKEPLSMATDFIYQGSLFNTTVSICDGDYEYSVHSSSDTFILSSPSNKGYYECNQKITSASSGITFEIVKLETEFCADDLVFIDENEDEYAFSGNITEVARFSFSSPSVFIHYRGNTTSNDGFLISIEAGFEPRNNISIIHPLVMSKTLSRYAKARNE